MELPPVGQSVRASQLDAVRNVSSNTASTASDPVDNVKISPNSLMVSRLLDKVNAMPETRPELIREFQNKIERGNYPPPMVVEGFAKLIGGALNLESSVKAASATDTSSSSND